MADTLGSIRTEVLNWLDETSNTTETYNNVTNAIKRAHTKRCTEAPWSFMLWPQVETFSLVANQRRYPIHNEFYRPLYMFNKATKEYLIETPWRQMESSGVRWNTDTTGNRYIFSGYSPVATQPTAATNLSIVSTSGSDSGASFGVIIRGISSTSNAIITETINPSGTTPVGSAAQFSLIMSVEKIVAWSGTLTLSGTGGTFLTLAPSELSRSYPLLETLWLPTTTDSIEYRFYRKPRVLSNASDTPDIPEPFSQILVWDALISMAAYDGDMQPARIGVWKSAQEDLFDEMNHTFLEGSSIAAEPQFIRGLSSENSGSPRIYG